MIKIFINISLAIIFISIKIFGQSNFELKLDNHKYFEQRKVEIIINEKENVNYKIEELLEPYFSLPEVAIFENGNCVLIHSVEGIVKFYSKGNLQNQIKLLRADYYNESSILFDINKNKIALLITEDQKNKIVLLNNIGEEIFTKYSQNGFGSGIAISEENSLIAVSINSWNNNKLVSESIITNFQNNLEISFPYKFTKGSFGSEPFTFFGLSNNEIFLADLDSNKILWNKKSADDSMFLESKSIDDIVLVVKVNIPKLINGSWKYHEAVVSSIDLKGIEKNIQTISRQFENLYFIKDNNELYLQTENDGSKIILKK